ncbi:MAG TPA: SIS domain-containing protein [Leifsonia sp.]|nr:SIS domain-containing protein [Leifsonia sp.]
MTASVSGAPATPASASALAPGERMRAEIAEQPARWLDLLSTQRAAIDAAAELITTRQPELIVFAARGSSDHAAMYGQYLAHNLLRIPALLATPATLTAFGTRLHYPRSVAIAVSQSGQSPDLLATVAAISDDEVPVIATTNNERSALAGLADVHIPLSAGAELSVAATKTYTAELLALALVLNRAAGSTWGELERRVTAIAETASTLLESDDWSEPLADSVDGCDRILVVGRGYAMATAKEGALKLMETNALAASGWSAADATHGPLGQVVPGSGVIALTGGDAGRESVLEFAEAATALGGRVVEIGADAIPSASARVAVATADMAFAPLVEILPLQRLALTLALRHGLDPDNPAGLNKVTLTN